MPPKVKLKGSYKFKENFIAFHPKPDHKRQCINIMKAFRIMWLCKNWNFAAGSLKKAVKFSFGCVPWEVTPSLWWVIRGGSARKGCLSYAPSILKGRENRHFSIWKGHKIHCKVKEMAAKAKCIGRVPKFGRNNNVKHIKAWTALSNWACRTASPRKCGEHSTLRSLFSGYWVVLSCGTGFSIQYSAPS